MKTILLAAATLTAIVGTAAAADLPMKTAAPVIARPACSQFGGFYVGAQGGWAGYDWSWKDKDNWTGTASDGNLNAVDSHTDKSGFAGGVTGGYNWQSGCVLFGAEADYSWASINANQFITTGRPVTEGGATIDLSSQLRGFGTLRGRTGVVVEKLLIYVTGGLAWANFNRSWTVTSEIDGAPFAETFTQNKTRWGGALGVGTEWDWGGGWSVKSDILYMRFPKSETTFTTVLPGVSGVCPCEPSSRRFGNQDSIWTARIGVNYRFGSLGL